MKKLSLLGFTESDDPCSESNAAKFTYNLTLWPAVESSDISLQGQAYTTPSLETTGCIQLLSERVCENHPSSASRYPPRFESHRQS